VKHPRLLLAVQVATIAAILACVGVLAARHPWRVDLTPDRRFTLTAYTRSVLASLPFPIVATYFYGAHDQVARREVEALLRLYADGSPRLTVRMRDLDRNPGEAHRLGATAYNVLVLEAGDRIARVDVQNEEFVTAALVRLGGSAPTIAYLVQGHGEGDVDDPEGRRGLAGMVRALEADGFTTRRLMGVATVPPDAQLVVVAGPTRDLHDQEIQALADYVARGGGLLVLADPPTPPSVGRLLAPFGLELGDDLVVDQPSRLLGADGLTARVAFLNQSLVPGGLEVGALLPLAQTVRLVEHPGVTSDYLAVTGEAAWADVSRRALDGGTPVFRADADRAGPLPIAAFARAGAEGGRLVVVGDADFATNLHLDLLGNRDLLGAVAQLASRGTASAERRPERPEETTFSPLVLSARETRLLLVVAAILPTLVFAAGGWLAWRRAQA
jgi:ABC-type uncharacterized transport system involved in gliding motility auxiliary subunit